MKKINAYQVAPEVQDGDWDHIADDDGRLWSVLDGDGEEHKRASHCGSYRESSWAYMRDELVNASKDYRRICCGLDVSAWYNDGKDGIDEMCAVAKDNGVKIGSRIRKELHRLADEYFGSHDSKKPEVVAEILSLVTANHYAVREIRGCCQGDFATLVVPADMEQEAIDEIEARYFNTGNEWRVEDEDGEIICHSYTWTWNDDKQERQMREQIDGYIADDYALDIYEFNGYEPRVPKYSKR